MARLAEAGPGFGSTWKIALLLAGLASAGLALRGQGVGLLSGARPTVQGAATLVTAGAVLAAVGVPRQVVAFAGGYVFGAWRGGALALMAQLLGCMLNFWWARAATRDWAITGLGGRLARLNRMLTSRPFVSTLTLRLLPVGSNLVLNLAAGASRLPAGPFLAATLLGYIPHTAVFALTGSGVHVDRSVQIGLGASLFVASAALGWFILRSGARNPHPSPLPEGEGVRPL